MATMGMTTADIYPVREPRKEDMSAFSERVAGRA
jgi:hypothetical protein